MLLVAQEQRAHGGRERQRHERRNADGHGHGDGKFAEQAADDSAHQQQRNEYRDERDADGHDGEADFAGALERRLQRGESGLYVAVDVLQHDDGVVDHEAHRDGQRHQRQIVETVVEHIHHRCRAEQRQRNGDPGNDGGPGVAQEQEYHHHHQRDRQREREFHVVNGGLDGGGAIGNHVDLDRGRHRGERMRQQRFDALFRLDDIGAGLLVDQQQNAVAAVLPGRQQRVLRTVDRDADVANAHRCAVLVRDDHVVPGCGLQQLVVVVDRHAARRTVDRRPWARPPWRRR